MWKYNPNMRQNEWETPPPDDELRKAQLMKLMGEAELIRQQTERERLKAQEMSDVRNAKLEAMRAQQSSGPDDYSPQGIATYRRWWDWETALNNRKNY